MTVIQLKKVISSNINKLPNKMIWIDNNHTLLSSYLDQLSLVMNRKIQKIFTADEAISSIPIDFDQENKIYVLYLLKKEVEKVLLALDDTCQVIAILPEDDEKIKSFEKVVFGGISRNACIKYLDDFFEVKDKATREKFENYVEREQIERLVDYYDNDLDLCMNEAKKLIALELPITSKWERQFEAILECLPKKDGKLRSLPWYSGGDIDTCQVLYNLYVKKLRTIQGTDDEQNTWALLVRESVWLEACMVSGVIGDYVMDYLKLVESSLPEDFEIKYFPPVFFHELKDFPEYGAENGEQRK